MIAHDLDLYRADFDDDGIHGVCNCGWSSRVSTHEDVIEQWENHCDEVFMDPMRWEP